MQQKVNKNAWYENMGEKKLEDMLIFKNYWYVYVTVILYLGIYTRK